MKRLLLVLTCCILGFSFLYSQDKEQNTVIKNVNLIDGNGSGPIRSSLKIENGVITMISASMAIEPSENLKVIDGEGKYLIPGLIDSHVHLMMGGDETGQKKLLQKMLNTGVTTVQDLVGDGRDLAYFSKQQKRGIIQSPEIHFAAMFTTSDFMKKDFRMAMFPEGRNGELPFLQAVDDNTDYKKAIARANGTGASAIKLYAGLSKHSMKHLTEEAHKMNMKVWCHPAQFPLTANDILDLDIDVYCHAGLLAYTEENIPSEYHEWMDKLYQDEHYQTIPESLNIDPILKVMLEHNTILDATLSAWKYSDEAFALATKIAKRAHELGVKMTTGTDIQGFPTLEELYFMVEVVGLTPKEALMSSSKNGAEAIGILETHGTIETGKVANLVLLNENPLENIRNLESIELVLINGNSIQPD